MEHWIPAGTNLSWFYQSEGWFLWPQVFLAVAALMLAYSSLDWIRTGLFVPPQLVEQLQQPNVGSDPGRALAVLNKDRKDASPLEDVLVAAFRAAQATQSKQETAAALERACEAVEISLERRLNYLSTLANVALMVGLLGTVWGLMGTFMVISIGGEAPPPSKLAEGVSQALSTTVAGLFVAIPSQLVYGHLRGIAHQIMHQLESTAQELIERCAVAAPAPAIPITTSNSSDEAKNGAA